MRLRLAEFRDRARLTQEEVAAIAGVSPKTEWNWEKGKSYPNASQLWDMAEAMGCSPNELVGWYEDHQREAARTYADPRQARINSSFEKMNDEGRDSLAKVARSMERDPANLAVKDGPERLDAAERVS